MGKNSGMGSSDGTSENYANLLTAPKSFVPLCVIPYIELNDVGDTPREIVESRKWDVTPDLEPRPRSDSDPWSSRVAALNPWRAPSPRCSSSTSRAASSSGGTTAGTSPQYRPSASSQKEGDPESHSPVAFDGGISYMFIQHNNVFLMTAARQNCNAASILLFLHRVIDVFKHYFEELEEESLRDNFVVVVRDFLLLLIF
ncbi:uncharacterized protein LOC141827126 [Curcuma longa]|uniref:uncharacterized protein LOC141827126 n=1 Tax=Curcuma longa TaxID=136217 RepID=UPI003D9EBC4B